jgi:hypothetical protein
VTLEYLSRHEVDIAPGQHVAIAAVRNESLRLPYLLAYYRALGIERFLFVDNASDDGTRELLLAQDDCLVFGTPDSFLNAHLGLEWKNQLLHRYCRGHWILGIDADELLVWPGSEGKTIQTLTAELDAMGAAALAAMLVDMYSDRPFGAIGYHAGKPFLDSCPFFDRGPYRTLPSNQFPPGDILGGVRARTMRASGAGFHPPLLTKLPLVKWAEGQWYVAATHRMAPEVPLAPMRAALLHFKMFDDLPEKCRIESERGQYFAGGREYRVLGEIIRRGGGASFFSEAHSVRYTGTEQLLSLGLISRERAFESR